MTQMPLPLAPSRAAWEAAAAAAPAEGGRPARRARGKRRHLLFPRSFPAAPSETQPAGPAPPPLARALARPAWGSVCRSQSGRLRFPTPALWPQ